ncbi:uncharacterized protein EKO05_0006685 [Ascochyta rabiei]|uniref:Uncharacterized protein n=1 Tax=Didymella rabiei TaxID=5454 RepID=A0A162WBH0_DIDRA|nr:uncharacterized protein EKO05_0006685 [Ascochyta rabiei]KZM18931.1 hypothetical protein ST47_g9937 [Ascochyta rabiei]UPX16275.1 hypothetical protein EKO05_0006685 [Ascochyta rabiei]
MAPGGFASIALARTLSSQSASQRTTCKQPSCNTTAPSDPKKTPGVEQHGTRHVNVQRSATAAATSTTSTPSVLGTSGEAQIWSPTKPLDRSMQTSSAPLMTSLRTSIGGLENVRVGGVELSPSRRFENALDAGLREMRRVECERVGREVWW